MPQLAVAVASKMRKLFDMLLFNTLLLMALEKSATSQFFFIIPESPVKGMMLPSKELVAIAFFTRAIWPLANNFVLVLRITL
jgi:hypothetical protein